MGKYFMGARGWLHGVLAGALLAGWLAAAPGRAAEGARARDFSPGDSARLAWEAAPGLRTRERPPEGGAEGPDAAAPFLGTVDAAHGDSLMIPARFPGSVTVSRGDRANPVYFVAANRFAKGGGAAIATLAFSLHVPASLPAGARLSATVFLKDKDGRWYQATPNWEGGGPATALRPGWNRLAVDFTEAAAMFRPVGHGAGWTRYRLSQTVQVGVTIDCDAGFSGLLALDDFVARPSAPEARPLGFVNLRFPKEMQQNRLYEFALNVNRELVNPFSPAEIDIIAEIFAPGAAAPCRVPAFYYQGYRREKGADDGSGDLRDRFVPEGPAEFRVRYLPPAPGRYRVRLRANYTCPFTGAAATCATPDYEFAAVANPDPVAARRFVRVSPRDPRAFEFSNGEWFYPTGLNMHNPMDVRYDERIVRRFFPGRKPLRDRGLRCYEDAFPAMQKSGMNVFEVWMSSWWLTLEWTSRWKGFQGLGRYNLENAWKLDSLLASAAEHGLYAHLVVDNHGKGVDRRGREAEWPHSPYNVANWQDDGVCRRAAELFTSEKAMAHYRDMYRYLAARWGWCPNIFGVEMWSELNLVSTNVRSETMYAWHAAMEKAFHEWDQGRHLMTTHYSGDYNTIDLEMDRRPHIDYIVGDAYHGDGNPLARVLDGTDARLFPVGKPFMMTEFGGNWDAGSLEGLFGDVFGGLWVSWTSRAAGAPLCWWYDHILQENLGVYYAAFRRYADGEDKRRAPGEPQLTLDWGGAALGPGDQGKLDAARQEAEADKAEQTRLLAEFNRKAGELEREVAERRSGRERANRELTKARQEALAAKVEKAKAEKAARGQAEGAQAEKENAPGGGAAPAPAGGESANDDPGVAAAATASRVKGLEAEAQAAAAALQAAEKALKEHRETRKNIPSRPTVVRAGGHGELRFFFPARAEKARAALAGLANLQTRVLGDGGVFYVYVFDPGLLHHMPLKEGDRPLSHGVVLAVGKVPDGQYAVEVWDCYRGEVVARLAATAAGGNGLSVPLPDFRIQTALKIRRQP